METRLKRKASLVTSRPYLIVTLAEDWRKEQGFKQLSYSLNVIKDDTAPLSNGLG